MGYRYLKNTCTDYGGWGHSIPIYPGGGRLCLSACLGDEGVEKNCRPLKIISGTALTDGGS